MLFPMSRHARFPYPWNTLSASVGGATKLADILGVNYATLYRWVHGISAPSVDNQSKIYALFEFHNIEVLPVYRTLRP